MSSPNLKNYHFIEKIGEGSYSTVYKAFKQDNLKEIVAIKCIEKSKISTSLIDNIITEISLLKNLKHKNIVQMKDFYWDSRFIYIIMEYCNRGDLSNFIKKRRRIPEEICRKFMQQLSLAIKYLRTQEVCHMDLKPQNILLTFDIELILKLADFGLAKYIPEHERMNTLCGSPLYMAPEIILKKDYDAKVDLWSMGIILYECLFGRAPYSSPDLPTLLTKIKSQSSIEIPTGLSKSCDNFLKGLLKHEPNERFTYEVVFKHPWLDLEHIPTPDNFSKGVQFAQQAIAADTQGKYQKALDLYCNALNYLGPCVLNEKDPVKKATLHTKIDQYLSRAEYLKINHTNPVTQGSSPSTETFASSSQGSNEKVLLTPEVKEFAHTETGLIKQLKIACKSSPKILAALEIGCCAELYYKDCNYLLALEKYESSLGELVQLLTLEPVGQRRHLLLLQIEIWMKQAEFSKSKTTLMNINKPTEKAEDYCSLQ